VKQITINYAEGKLRRRQITPKAYYGEAELRPTKEDQFQSITAKQKHLILPQWQFLIEIWYLIADKRDLATPGRDLTGQRIDLTGH